MALCWNFKEKCGTVTHEKSGTFNWYEGNGLMIVLNEWKEDEEDYYSMNWFFCDIDHAKNCLGLNTKGGYGENMFSDDPITEVTISRTYSRYWKKLVDVLVKAFPDIKITLF